MLRLPESVFGVGGIICREWPAREKDMWDFGKWMNPREKGANEKTKQIKTMTLERKKKKKKKKPVKGTAGRG